MSTDAKALIYYGFPLEDWDDPEFLYHELNETWEKQRRPTEPEDKSSYRTPEWDEWRTEMREWEASPENVKIDWSGCENDESYYVHAEGLEVSVEWGEQKPLAEVDLLSQPEADKFIREFCEKTGIEYKQPGWHLASLYF